MTTIRNRIPEIVAELNELADGNYNLGTMREELPSDCATLLVGLTTELNVQLAMARKREADLVAALRTIVEAASQSGKWAARESAKRKAIDAARAVLATVMP